MRQKLAKKIRKAVYVEESGNPKDPEKYAYNRERDYQTRTVDKVTKDGKLVRRVIIRNHPQSQRGLYLAAKKAIKEGRK